MGITDPAELPEATIERRSQNRRRRRCPKCGRSCYRDSRGERRLNDFGDLRSGRPHILHVTYSKHRCENCRIYFNSDMSRLAPPGAHYTHRVIYKAMRLVIEDGLPYRAASWHMWRDHRVFVPWATIQEWVEASGEKMRAAHSA